MPFVDSRIYSRLSTFLLFTLDFYSPLSTITLDIYSRLSGTVIVANRINSFEAYKFKELTLF